VRKGIVANGRMPDRRTSAERIAHLDEDVRDVTSRLKVEIENRAQTMHTEGWTLLDDWEMAVNGRNIVVVGKIERLH